MCLVKRISNIYKAGVNINYYKVIRTEVKTPCHLEISLCDAKSRSEIVEI